MKLTDRLIQDTKLKEDKKKKRGNEEPDDMQAERDPLHFIPINAQKGVFTPFDKDNSINTNESVFDRTATFRTSAPSDFSDL